MSDAMRALVEEAAGPARAVAGRFLPAPYRVEVIPADPAQVVQLLGRYDLEGWEPVHFHQIAMRTSALSDELAHGLYVIMRRKSRGEEAKKDPPAPEGPGGGDPGLPGGGTGSTGPA